MFTISNILIGIAIITSVGTIILLIVAMIESAVGKDDYLQ